jgi:hypothetical protein
MKVTFINSLYCEELDDVNWMLIADFIVDADTAVSSRRITVPIGFQTDFASVPRIPVVFELYGNKAHEPAVVHDYLYSLGGTEADREYADNVLRAGIIAKNEGNDVAEAIYLGVRAGGASHWKYITPAV